MPAPSSVGRNRLRLLLLLPRSLNWCLRPPRVRRMQQARASLAYRTPLPLCAGARFIPLARFFNTSAFVAFAVREAVWRVVPVQGSPCLRSKLAAVRSFGRSWALLQFVCWRQIRGRQSPPKCAVTRSVGALHSRRGLTPQSRGLACGQLLTSNVGRLSSGSGVVRGEESRLRSCRPSVAHH